MHEKHLEIRMLGTAKISVDGTPLKGWRAGKALKLFQCLAFNHGEVVPRSQLIEALRPGEEQSGCNGSLKVVVHSARSILKRNEKELGSSLAAIEYADFGYQLLAEGAWVDTVEFAALIKQAAIAEGENNLSLAKEMYANAAELCQVTFLPDDDSEWACRERIWIDSLRVKILNRLAAAEARGGCDFRAMEYCKQLIKLDPYNEDVYRLMMRIHSSRGELGMALKWYSEGEEVLKNELGVDPSEATIKTLEESLAMCGVYGALQ